jgi:hypothetical protein
MLQANPFIICCGFLLMDPVCVAAVIVKQILLVSGMVPYFEIK